MGIDITGYLMVGGDYEDVAKMLTEEQKEDICKTLEELGLTSASPYFDADIRECFIGYVPTPLMLNLDDPNWMNEILEYKEKWKELTGTPAYLIGTQHVY